MREKGLKIDAQPSSAGQPLPLDIFRSKEFETERDDRTQVIFFDAQQSSAGQPLPLDSLLDFFLERDDRTRAMEEEITFDAQRSAVEKLLPVDSVLCSQRRIYVSQEDLPKIHIKNLLSCPRRKIDSFLCS